MSRPGSTVAVVPSTPMGSQQPHALYATHDERDNETTDFIAKRSPSTMLQRFKYIAIGTTALSVVLLIVVIAVASSKKGGGDCGPSPPSSTTPGNAGGAFTDDTKVPDLAAQFAKLVNNESIKAFMTEYSLYPHNTASARNVELAEMTANYYKSFGFDEYRVDRIPVLLSQLTDHSVTVNDDAGHPRYRATLYEPNILFELNYSQAILPSNAYSGTGDVTAPIVWVNYGRLQDFQEAQKHVNITGKIVVVRYGQIFRGNKAAFAEQFGAVGCIIVMDPADVAQGTVFPLGPWATNATVQRGSLLLSDGDPRTPLWPSEDGGPTMPDADLFDPTKGVGTPLPSIPVQPMGYGDATEMLRGLGGASLPNGTTDWRSTGFLGVMGGGMGPSKYTVRLMVQRELVVDHLANAHGVIRGAVEPDRVVNIGGHRDAWTYGAVDPISGASISLEIARCLGELLKTGWRPRRTIQFSSWGGEEQALLGSTEYVQGEVEMLRERSVAYINLDTPVTGNDVFTLEGSPSFLNLALDVGKSYTAYGVTLQKRMAVQTISPPGSGSDHTSFIQLAGVPVFVPELTSSDGRYGAVYHTNYDTVFWVEHFGDPLYDGHKAVAQLVGDMVLKLAGLNVLPLNLEAYSTSVAGWVAAYETASNLKTFDFSFMDAQVALFSASAKNFEVSKQAIANTIALEYPAVTAISPYLLRDFNDRTSGLERVFLGGSQETLSLFFKHVLFTPSAIDSYGSSVMPMVAAALNTGDPAQGNFALGRIAQFVSRAARFLNTSTHIL